MFSATTYWDCENNWLLRLDSDLENIYYSIRSGRKHVKDSGILTHRPDNLHRWYAVNTQPRKEKLALLHMQRQAFTVFCPYQRLTSRTSKGYRTRLTPFFPNYLFVRMDLSANRWQSINGTIGVRHLVQFGEGGLPAPLPSGIIERFQKLSDDDGELVFDEELSPGDQVKILSGPFADMCGTLISAGNLERETILLNILSGETKVKLGREFLAPA